ncbi:SDR family NAD(P)-dependent oxidoreductase [Persicimonas caeni]|uniref:SDR family NAD(P)-dependent oxidoreductase n=1 Tax=Persicimonas caeni TaxID=2292766 RepID=A0A4Y6PT85_PERCE|nr:SDR family NAD(P)-dependent oxidoreductase [Persicimonas caeni]QDG50985.1 SDR family NAD(P)-dependent oxidoreductase [Persicimonas caeni]QED32206.1 SDR family NAD(P)-dependent oxidoreductase [Persicimonas caeni]
MGLLDGKVVAITGAGGGLGRAHALLMAQEGAKIVVNDLGGAVDGEGESSKFADKVVAEIKEAGGEAVANYASVADAAGAQSIIDDAVEAFGRIDIVVNNAGILRDKTLVKMTEEMWDAVIAVHLKGTYLVTQAAVRQMMKQESGGRIINTSSLAGLLGNFGQTNYAAAKAGIAGITRTVAMEGQRFGITVNAIAPVAKTRMTEDIDAVPEQMEPADIAPLVAWLASDEAADVTGRIFGAHGSHYFEYKMQRTPGIDLASLDSGEERWTPAKVGERIDEIGALPQAGGEADSEAAAQVRALFEALPQTLRADKAGSWKATIQFEVEGTGTYTIDVADGQASFQGGPSDDRDGKVTFDSADTLLALASGKLKPEQAFMGGKIGSDNMDILMKFGKLFDLAKAASALGGPAEEADADEAPEGLNRDMLGTKFKGAARFVKAPEMVAYAEATEDPNPHYVDVEREGGIVAPPLFSQKLFHEVMGEAITDEALNADLLRLVHGEQDMRFHRPLEPWDLVAARAEIAEIEDKSSGQLLTIRQWLVCEGELVAESTSGLFIRGSGSGGGGKKKKKAPADEIAPEDREIVVEDSQFVAVDQPLRYAEASGDHNPIHTDPKVAESAGLPSVILHGMCTMAFAQKAIVNGVCDGDPRRLKRLRVRFSKPVLPEQTVTTRVWKLDSEQGVTTLGFEAVNDDGQTVLSRGLAEVVESA